ncbi:unnamed protein product [Cylindrotheca closterium]|uniref:Orc1-like AAA ATPase domain-containing protein n=1 Tax=Cylindrotheca closterium TaxID=2856 RepID=A0AAD2CMD7_9STRA|nr:unnamed protein product [Cylindrotheca closterium]
MPPSLPSDLHSSELPECQELTATHSRQTPFRGDESKTADEAAGILESALKSSAGDVVRSEATVKVTLSAQLKKAQKVQHKLPVDELGMVGREQEQKELTSSFDHIFHVNSEELESFKKQVVLVSGKSGTGKSKLIDGLCQYASSSKHSDKTVLLARGKYDFNEYFVEPYSGIVAGFEHLFHQIKTHEGGSLSVEAIGSSLREELGQNTETLLRLLPGLEDILPSDTSAGAATPSNEVFNVEASQKQLKYSFQVLVRVLCEHCTALLLVLNDLQWADEASLDIVDHLISDVQNQNALMVVGCYRSDEVDDTHALSRKIRALRGKSESQKMEMTDIHLGAFSLESTNNVIMRLLSIGDSLKTKDLADICFKRTNGNPHFLIELLMLLKDADLLRFGRLQWEWDESEIESFTKSINTVEALLQSRMEKLLDAEKLLLQYAACLGSSFQVDVLNLVWKNHSANNFDSKSIKDLESLLRGLEKGHYIESIGVNKYGWVHDKVQEAALSLGDSQESSFQFEIGTILFKTLDEGQLDGLLFDVVDLINQGNVKRRPELAVLNLQAAEKARRVSAFSSASLYVAHGIDLLPSDKWSSHRKTTLRLYTLGVQLGLATGDVFTMEEYRDEILSQKNCSIIEKLPIQVAHINRLCASSKYSKAIELSLDLLKELGCNLIPHRSLVTLQAIASLKSTINMAKKIVLEDFCQSHPLLTDPHQKAIIQALSKLAYAGFMNSNTFVSALATTRIIQITMKYGINSDSSVAFATLGLIAKSAFGDFATAAFLANTSRLLQYRDPNNFHTADALFLSYVFSIGWSVPLQDLQQPMKLGYLAGMRAGNNDYGFWCLLKYHVLLPLHTGRPLGTILARCPECLYQFEDYHLDEQCFYTRLNWQICLSLTGRAQGPTRLHGGIFNDNMDNETIPLRIATVKKAQVELWVLYGAYKQAADLAIECGDSYDKLSNLSFMCMSETFYRGLALYAAHCDTKQRKYKKHAKRARKKLALWETKGVPGVVHYHALLNAEQAAVDKKYKDADLRYQKAIKLAASTGYLNCAALFNERHANFLQQKGPYFESRSDDVVFRLGEAMRYYKEWGAVLKVEEIRKKKLIFASKAKLRRGA